MLVSHLLSGRRLGASRFDFRLIICRKAFLSSQNYAKEPLPSSVCNAPTNNTGLFVLNCFCTIERSSRTRMLYLYVFIFLVYRLLPFARKSA